MRKGTARFGVRRKKFSVISFCQRCCTWPGPLYRRQEQLSGRYQPRFTMSGRRARRSGSGRRRSGIFQPQAARASIARVAVGRKSAYQCRGVRKWCVASLRCRLSPPGFPLVVWYEVLTGVRVASAGVTSSARG